jgi:hypothetical protein
LELGAASNPLIFLGGGWDVVGSAMWGRRLSVEMARGLGGGRSGAGSECDLLIPPRSVPRSLRCYMASGVFLRCGGDGPTGDERGEHRGLAVLPVKARGRGLGARTRCH